MPSFDHNATAPLSPLARDAWLQAQEQFWQNPSSPTREAARVRLKLEAARETVGALLGASADRVVFTSGATESVQAIAAYLGKTFSPAARVAVNPTEHPCVLAAFGEAFPGRLVALTTDKDGIVSPDEVERAVGAGRPEHPIGAVAIMAANNETGVLQPWPELVDRCRRLRVPLVCDASQWIGKLPAAGLGQADWVFASAHKWGGPKGAGFLLRAPQADGFQGQRGGEQQRGHRGGTEDYPAVAAWLAAWVDAERVKVLSESERVAWREEFERTVSARIERVEIVGAHADRLWNTVSVIMPAHDNRRWVALLDKRGFAVSTGSACAAGKDGPSHVLASLGVSPDKIRRVLRLSSGWSTTREEWVALAEAFASVHRELSQ